MVFLNSYLIECKVTFQYSNEYPIQLNINKTITEVLGRRSSCIEAIDRLPERDTSDENSLRILSLLDKVCCLMGMSSSSVSGLHTAFLNKHLDRRIK